MTTRQRYKTMAKVQIEPKILKGFRDYLPQVMIPRRRMIHVLEQVFSEFGFAPIDTPAIEYTEILLGKGSQETDKQLYRFLDNGERDVSLRFDLTVPLARFVSMYHHELGLPFKRYHIAPVWRAEKPQRGRFREFLQCDFDIIGTLSTLADAEIIALSTAALSRLEVKHQTRINNRLVLNGLLEELGVQEKCAEVLRAVDKLDKIGEAAVREELASTALMSPEKQDRLFGLLSLSKDSTSNAQIISRLKEYFSSNETAGKGIQQLDELMRVMPAYGIDDKTVVIDLSIARGLDYYTGVVFETTFLELPQIGSIFGGGRYDNLTALYSKEHLPGVGGSIGLDRVIAGLEELGRIPKTTSPAQILLLLLDESSIPRTLEIATQLRNAGLCAEVYPELTKIGTQLKYATKKGIPWALFAGEKELAGNCFSLKNLGSGKQTEELPLAQLLPLVKQHLMA